MMELLLLSCTAAKRSEPSMVRDMYLSRAWNLVREHQGALRDNGVQIAALSAQHGVIAPMAIIQPYDQRMTFVRASHLAVRALANPMVRGAREIYIHGGAQYRDCARQIGALMGMTVTELVGANRGCGDHYSALKTYVYSRIGKSELEVKA